MTHYTRIYWKNQPNQTKPKANQRPNERMNEWMNKWRKKNNNKNKKKKEKRKYEVQIEMREKGSWNIGFCCIAAEMLFGNHFVVVIVCVFFRCCSILQLRSPNLNTYSLFFVWWTAACRPSVCVPCKHMWFVLIKCNNNSSNSNGNDSVCVCV